jgi:hypothetical protein
MSKKSIKIVVIAFLAVFLLLLAAPFIFKNKIIERVKVELNRNLDAELDFGKFSVSLLRSFPRVSLVVNDFSIVGKGAFEGDTLASIERSVINFNLFSLFKKTGFEITNTRFDNARLSLKVLEDGAANWNILKEDEEESESSFLLHLTRVEVQNGYVSYVDDDSTIKVFAEDINLVLSGDLTSSITNIVTRDAKIGSLSVGYAGMPLLSRVVATVNAEIEADLENLVYTFKENEVMLNALPVSFDGSIAVTDDATIFDLDFAATRSEFKNFLSILPAIYTKDFESIESSGNLELNGFLRGAMTEETLPPFGINLKVQDGMFKYPQLPSSVSGVNLVAAVSNPGKTNDETVVDVSELRMLLGNNPIEGKLKLQNLISDPHFDAFLKGRVDLGQVQQFFPLEEGTNLEGILDGDLKIAGKMSDVNANRYDRFTAEGYVTSKNLFYSDNKSGFNTQVKSLDVRLSPRFLQVNDLDVIANESDLSAKGRFDNIIGFVLDKQLLKGSFDATSSFFNLNLFINDELLGESNEAQSVSAIQIPSNIDVLLNGRFDKVLYGDLEITDVAGKIAIKDGVANLDNLAMKVLGGNLNLAGKYAYHENGPVVEMKLDVVGLDIQKAFNAFETFRMLAPVASHAFGNFSASFTLNGILDQNMVPQPQTLSGLGRFNSQNVSVQGIPAMTKLAALTHLENLEKFIVNDVLVLFEFGNGRVTSKPFDFKFGQSKANVKGSIGFDQSLDYTLSLDVPRSQFGSQAMGVVNDLQQKAAARGLTIKIDDNVKFEAKIGGTFANPQVSFDLAQAAAAGISQIADQVQQQVTTAITDKVDDVVATIDAELEARVNAFLNQARQQAENVRQESKRLANAVRAEAAANAKKLENEATNDLQRMLARQAGNVLINNAEEQALRIEREGETNAQRIIDLAEERARKIRLGEEKLE